MKRQLIALLVLISTSCFGQSSFQKTIGGASDDLANAVEQTVDGGYIISGETASFGAGSRDVYVVRLDSAGTILWSRTYGGSGEDYSVAMARTSDGGYILGAHTGSFGQGGHDYYMIKTDANGDSIWTHTYGGSSSDGIYSMLEGNDETYIVGGHTSSFGAGAHEYYLMKTEVNGDTVWTRTYGGAGGDYLRAINREHRYDTPDVFLMVGETTNFGAGGVDVLLVKTDHNGDTLWSKAFGGSSNDFGNDVIATFDRDIVVAGTSTSFGEGMSDVYLLKIDETGDLLWARTYGGPGDDIANSIQMTADGGFIIAGSTNSFGADGICDVPCTDVYLIRTDANGDTLWTRTFGGFADEDARSVKQTTDGGYVVAGTTSTSDFGAQLRDIFVFKTDANGNSGCNQFSTSTVVGNTLTTASSAPVSIGSGAVLGNRSTIISDPPTEASMLCDTVLVGIPPGLIHNPLKVHPNPFSDHAVIEFENENMSKHVLYVYNATEQLVAEVDDITNGRIVVDRNNLKAGVYLFRLFRGREIAGYGKLVIN